MRRLAVFLCFLPAAALVLVVLAECGVRALYAYAMRRTERFPLLYERVYWDVPPWVRYMSILYADRDLGLWMRSNTTAAATPRACGAKIDGLSQLDSSGLYYCGE